MEKKISYAAGLICIIIAGIVLWRMGLRTGWFWAGCAVLAGILHIVFSLSLRPKKDKKYFIPTKTPTELVLLSEEDGRIASWYLYGKNGIVIGRDVGENQVTVNLDHTEYASMIDVEHAVLNFAKDAWYVEDISSKNGVRVQKSDGRKYKIAYGKPCRLEQGDILFVGLARLQIQ
ncbi:MAG: FHA domain-containing protein [Lachnospiraceae bacterium]